MSPGIPDSRQALLSRWTMPTLRISMGLFLLSWGLDKVLAVPGSQKIFERFYNIEAGTALIQLAGIAEVALALLLMAGLLRGVVAWAVLILNSASTFASWRQIIDPWGLLGLSPGGSHLFLASIVIMAVSVVLVLNSADDTLSLGTRHSGRSGPRD